MHYKFITSSHLLNNELSKRMRIWRAVRGEGSELGSSSRARGTPLAQGEGSELGIGPDPKAPPTPCWGCRRTGSVGVGVVEGFWKTRDNGGKAA